MFFLDLKDPIFFTDNLKGFVYKSVITLLYLTLTIIRKIWMNLLSYYVF